MEIDGLKRNAQSTDIIALPAEAYANTAGRTAEYVQISWNLKIRKETRKRCKTMIGIHVFQKLYFRFFFSLTTKHHATISIIKINLKEFYIFNRYPVLRIL